MTRTGLIFRGEFEADIADRFDANGKFRAKTRRNPARGAGSMTSTADEPEGAEAKAVALAYGVCWGLLTRTPFGPAFFKEGHGDGAQNYMICFEKREACMIVLANSDNGELAFRTLLEGVFGNTVTPWEWEGYTPEAIAAARKIQN